MERDAQARKRLGAAQWTGLDTMIAAYAEEAVAISKADFHEKLDWKTDSLERLDRVLNRLSPAPHALAPGDSDWLTLLWGSYFGELLRRLRGGEWEMTVYPGTEFSVPTLGIAGSRLYPMMKVHRRLTLGASESIPEFYRMMAARLDAAEKQRERAQDESLSPHPQPPGQNPA